MLSFTVLIALFAFANAAILPESKIVGGSPASITDAPWQVALLYDPSNTGIYNQACGGVIISRTTIISAAQCVYGSLASQWRIRAGSSFHNSGGQVIQVLRYKVHEQYTSNNLANDIAILYLAAQITLSTSAATVTLPAQALNVPDNTVTLVTGWGRLSAGGVTPVQLNKMSVPVVNQAQCASAYSGYNTVTANMICAGRMGIGGLDACQGDTGGPMTANSILIGISSWGRGCGEAQYPGVYTRIPMYRNWINSNA